MYFSSANCKFLLNGRPLEEANSLQVQKEHNAVPVYSWNNRNWNFVADGKVLVTGSLVLNVSSPNYLTDHILGNTDAINAAAATSEENLREIDETLNRVNADIATYGGTASDVLRAAELRTEQLRIRALSQEEINNQNKVIHNNLSTLQIVSRYGENSGIIETIGHVRFTGKGVAYDAGSSQNIKYAFPFVARDMSI